MWLRTVTGEMNRVLPIALVDMHRDRGDEQGLADRAGGHALGETAEDLLLPRGQVHRLTFLGRHRPQGLRDRSGVRLQPALECRGFLVLRPQNVDDRREGRMVGGDGEEGHLEPLSPRLADLDGERKALHRFLGSLPRLVGDRTVAIAVDVPVGVAAAHGVVAPLSEHAARRLAQQFLALLVPEDDLVCRINGKDGLAAAGNLVEGLGGVGHRARGKLPPTGAFRPARKPLLCRFAGFRRPVSLPCASAGGARRSRAGARRR